VAHEAFDPDVTQRDEAPYWAASLILALRIGDETRTKEAREHLLRLGFEVTVAVRSPKGRAREVSNA